MSVDCAELLDVDDDDMEEEAEAVETEDADEETDATSEEAESDVTACDSGDENDCDSPALLLSLSLVDKTPTLDSCSCSWTVGFTLGMTKTGSGEARRVFNSDDMGEGSSECDGCEVCTG